MKKILDKIAQLQMFVASLLFFIIFLVNILEIISRSAFNHSFLWVSDFSVICVVWMICLAMSALRPLQRAPVYGLSGQEDAGKIPTGLEYHHFSYQFRVLCDVVFHGHTDCSDQDHADFPLHPLVRRVVVRGHCRCSRFSPRFSWSRESSISLKERIHTRALSRSPFFSGRSACGCSSINLR